ncbi:MAG: hypothetical protein C0436_01790 [Alphaproteobacteria bacterium]|nr:hypothetical protein [Alphaproteobacteria bacterium]
MTKYTPLLVFAISLLHMPSLAIAESPSPSTSISNENIGAVGATNPSITPVPRLENPYYDRPEGALEQQRALNAQKSGTLPLQETLDGRGPSSPTAPRINPAWKGVDGKSDK